MVVSTRTTTSPDVAPYVVLDSNINSGGPRKNHKQASSKMVRVPPSFTNIGLYGRSNQLQLPLSSLVEEFKASKARLVVTLKEFPR
ncbi:hypothetical protein DPMN_118131 [Dreissena polymorpha]|uniref:Uncharacterized protein n=1 Tax=Dreissena polymorpha TaxID=45954 RepID=A0A9D4GJL4_DREPO|nr:hypothetical protein DPMN_118131 [Dreissena polymorpha]